LLQDFQLWLRATSLTLIVMILMDLYKEAAFMLRSRFKEINIFTFSQLTCAQVGSSHQRVPHQLHNKLLSPEKFSAKKWLSLPQMCLMRRMIRNMT
jgi:hypothetical protein